MYENGYLNIGAIGVIEDPDSGVINALTAEQEKAVREYVTRGIDKPIIAKIVSLGDNLSQSGYAAFGGYQFMNVSVRSSRITLYAPLRKTEEVDVSDDTLTLSTTEYVGILDFAE